MVQGMIMTKIMEEEQKNRLKEVQNTFARSKINFRTTGLAIRKIHHQDSQGYGITNDRTSSASPAKVPSNGELTNPEHIGQNCTNFMKTYIEKLKRQRKRQKKKVSLSNQKQSSIVCNITAFPSIQHGQQKLLLLQKINPQSFRSNSIKHTPSARDFNNNYLYEIIKEIKEQRGVCDRLLMKKRLSQGLPNLDQKESRASKKFLAEPLDPWQAQLDGLQPSFQCFK